MPSATRATDAVDDHRRADLAQPGADPGRDSGGSGWTTGFFDLSTGLAGAFLQKFVNYQHARSRSSATSPSTCRQRALRAFVIESNRGQQVWFLDDLDQLADARLDHRCRSRRPRRLGRPRVEPTDDRTDHQPGPGTSRCGLGEPDEHHRVSTPLELLFDLCFVVAVAQGAAGLDHSFVENHVVTGTIQYLMVFFAIWWAWMNFTWFASAYDNDDVPYRLTVLVQIAGSLVMAAGIPRLFTTATVGDRHRVRHHAAGHGDAMAAGGRGRPAAADEPRCGTQSGSRSCRWAGC